MWQGNPLLTEKKYIYTYRQNNMKNNLSLFSPPFSLYGKIVMYLFFLLIIMAVGSI